MNLNGGGGGAREGPAGAAGAPDTAQFRAMAHNAIEQMRSGAAGGRPRPLQNHNAISYAANGGGAPRDARLGGGGDNSAAAQARRRAFEEAVREQVKP